MNILNEKELLNKGKNLIFYKKDVQGCYKRLKDEYRCVYIDEPRTVRVRLREILGAIAGDKYGPLVYKSIPELQESIIEECHLQTLIILFNGFERLTEKSSLVYSYLHEKGNIVFICSVIKLFKSRADIVDFYQTFVMVNKDEYLEKIKVDEINITYTVYFIIALLFFIVYLKAASSMYIAAILIGAAWFAFLIFRTLLFIGGKV